MKKRVLVIAALVSGALAVSGCTTNPYTGEREAGKSGIGAGIGSLVGAGVGALSSSKQKAKQQSEQIQLLPQEDSELVRRLKEIDIEKITPLQAMVLLAELKARV